MGIDAKDGHGSRCRAFLVSSCRTVPSLASAEPRLEVRREDTYVGFGCGSRLVRSEGRAAHAGETHSPWPSWTRPLADRRRMAGQPLSVHRRSEVRRSAADRGAERGICLVGDGMIHNHRRIRAAAGADRFYTASDLEAAIVLFEDHGAAAFERMWGPFALAIAGPNHEFAVGRDVLGLSPLYWVRDGETTLFASEMKAFDKHLRPRV